MRTWLTKLYKYCTSTRAAKYLFFTHFPQLEKHCNIPH